MEPAKSTSPLTIVRSRSSSAGNPSGTAPRPNITEPSVCPGAWRTSTSSPASVSTWWSATSTTRSGSRQVARPPNCCSIIASVPGARLAIGSCEPVPVVAVDVCRSVTRAHRGDGVDVVEVAVREQHRGRPKPVLGEHAPQRLLDADPRVDDEALLPRARARGRSSWCRRRRRERRRRARWERSRRPLPRMGPPLPPVEGIPGDQGAGAGTGAPSLRAPAGGDRPACGGTCPAAAHRRGGRDGRRRRGSRRRARDRLRLLRGGPGRVARDDGEPAVPSPRPPWAREPSSACPTRRPSRGRPMSRP